MIVKSYMTASALLFCCAITPCLASRAVVEDFVDMGTWRARGGNGITRGTAFAADYSLSGDHCPERPDGYAGVLHFDFDEQGPNMVAFERSKVHQAASVFADSITFAANPMGWPAALYFGVEDARRKVYYTKPVNIDKNGWNDYRIELNASTIKDFSKLEQPLRLRFVRMVLYKPGKGHMLLDDLALNGDVSRKQLLSVKPADKQLYTLPGDKAIREYLLRNGTDKDIDATFSVKLFDYNDRQVAEHSSTVRIPAYGINKSTCDFGILPLGSYRGLAVLSAGKYSAEFEPWLGVFTPNGKRVNFKPMYFGVQDTTVWNGPSENTLHAEWLKALGIDIVRYGTSGGRLHPARDMFRSDGAEIQLKEIMDAGIMVCLSYTENTPAWLQSGKPHYRRMADDMTGLAAHAQAIGNFCAKHPLIRYFEWWNEPDLNFLNDNFENYLKCMEVVYKNLKQVNPSLQVGTGGVTIKHPREKKNFSRDMYIKGKDFYDLAIFHAHGSIGDYVERNAMVEQWLKEAGKDVAIANTETGERSGYRPDSIRAQAETLVKKLAFAKSRNTEFYIWFTLQDYWDMDFEADDSFGLVTSDNQPKPSFIAYNTVIATLANSKFISTVGLDPRLESYKFRNDKGENVIVSWPKIAGDNFSLTLNTDKTVNFVSMFGSKHELPVENGRVSIPSTALPFYLTSAGEQLVRASELLETRPNLCAAPGSLFLLPFKVNNPENREALFVVESAGHPTVSIKLPPHGSAEASIPLKITRDNYGMFQDTLRLYVSSGGGQARKYTIPVSINAAYMAGNRPDNAAVIKLDTMNCVRELAYDPVIPRWAGGDDLSCKAKIYRDDNGLHMRFEVRDDRHIAKASGSDIWKNDSVQIAMTAADGVSIEVTLADSPSGPTAWMHSAPTGETPGPWKHPFSVKRQNNVTAYEIFVPYATIGMKGHPGERLRMAFLINEDDGLGRVRFMEWFGGIGSSKNPDDYGWLQLE